MTASLERPEGVSLRLILVRHAEPSEESRGRCYGKLDLGLSEHGRRQARELAGFTGRAGLSALYASPSLRARETASEIARASGLDFRCDSRLAEIDFGALEGMSYDEASERYPELYRLWMTRPTEVEFPEGESFLRMRARVREALSSIRENHRDASVAVVSHGGVNRIALADALGLPVENLFRLAQSHGAVNVIDYYDEAPVVVLVNGGVPC